MSEPIDGGRKIHFSYNHEGLRTQKKVEYADKIVTTDYLLHGKLVAHQTVTETDLSGNVLSVNEMHFVYDNDSRPAMVKFNGTMYFYRHNLQGDIVGIVDGDGNLVVEYKYNAWGTILSKTGSMASTLGHRNPFRYRGYIYDEETWMYWVKSRYYYPELYRFVNTDIVLGQIARLKTHNAYEYCYDDPMCYSDPSGNSPADAYNFYYNAANIDGPGLVGDLIGLAGAFLIYLWGWTQSRSNSTANTSTRIGTQNKPTASPSPSPTPTFLPEATPNPDAIYRLAVAFGTGAPFTFGPAYDDIDILIKLHVANWVGVYAAALKAESISGIPVAYGVYTPLREDAAHLASYFGGTIRSDSKKGQKYAHYHGVLGDYDQLHFWYGN